MIGPTQGVLLSLLSLHAVRYRYAGAASWALDGVTLDVAEGHVVALLGPNDAGKSTLALVAAGLAPGVIGGALEGRVELGGDATTEIAPHQAAQRCGVLFQNPLTQLSGTAATVWEEVAFGPRNVGLGVPEIVDSVTHALAAVGIAELAARDPARLSGGQAQLVALASVLALRPAVLVLDEPTSQLDPHGTALVGRAIRRLARDTGTAVLLIEHKTDLVALVADEVAVLDAGRIVARGATTSMLGDALLDRVGVDAPAIVRLQRTLQAAGCDADLVDRLPGLAAQAT